MIFIIELPLLILLLPANIKGIFGMIMLYFVLCCFLTYLKSRKQFPREAPKLIRFFIGFAISMFLVIQFIQRWQFSRKVHYIAETIGLDQRLFVLIIGTVCGIMAIYSLKVIWETFLCFSKNRSNSGCCVWGSSLDKCISSRYDKIMMFALITAAVYIGVFFICYLIQMLMFANYPAEYRDGALFKLVDDLASGYNPYAVETLAQTEPPVVVDSGFVNALPSVLIRRIFDIPASLSLYITNGIYIVLIILMTINIFHNIVFSFRANDKQIKVEMLCIIAWLLTFLQRATILVTRPDIFCCLLLLIIIDLYTKPVFRVRYIHFSAFLCVVVAFAKIHYAVIAASILIYFICRRDKYRSFSYIIQFSLAGIFFAILVFMVTEFLFPTYLSEWIPRIFDMFSQNVSFERASISFLLGKLKRLAVELLPAAIIIPYVYIRHDLNNSRKQLCSDNSRIFLVINIVVNFLVLLYVGRHRGADLWYFYVMLVPSIVFLTADAISRIKVKESVYALACIVVLIGCGMNMVPIVKSTVDTPAKVNTFKRAYSLIEEYESSEMYLSPLLSNYNIVNGVYNYNYGDGFYFVDNITAEKLYEMFPKIRTILPYTNDIYFQHEKYENEMLVKMQKKDYSLIVLDEVDCIPYICREAFAEKLEENYVIIEEVPVKYLTGETKLSYWIPKK